MVVAGNYSSQTLLIPNLGEANKLSMNVINLQCAQYSHQTRVGIN